MEENREQAERALELWLERAHRAIRIHNWARDNSDLPGASLLAAASLECLERLEFPASQLGPIPESLAPILEKLQADDVEGALVLCSPELPAAFALDGFA